MLRLGNVGLMFKINVQQLNGIYLVDVAELLKRWSQEVIVKYPERNYQELAQSTSDISVS
jgi:hypothetical protein